jgi:hypothetical protein
MLGTGMQVGAGTPSHSAKEGTPYWDKTNNILYVNNNGSTGWTAVGSSALATKEAAGTLFSPFDTIGGKTAKLMLPELWIECKARGSAPDHPIVSYSGIGMAVDTTGSTGSATANTGDDDGDAFDFSVGSGQVLYTRIGGWSSSQFKRRYGLYTYTKIKTGSDISNTLYWMPQIGSLITTTSRDPGGGGDRDGYGVVALQGTDSNFQLYSCKSGGGSTFTDTGVAFSADTLYECETWANATGVYCRINGGSLISYTGSNLPTSTVSMHSSSYSPYLILYSSSGTRTCRFYGFSARQK